MIASLLLVVACIGLDVVPGKVDDDTGGASLGGLEIGATEVLFGDVQVGERSEETLTLRTDGEAIRVEATLDDGVGVFSLDTTALTVEGENVLVVGFAPAESTDYAADLTLAVEGGDTLVLPVSGTGVAEGGEDSGQAPAPGPDIVVDPTSHDFGSVDTADTLSATFTIRNDGDDDLLVEDAVATGGSFSVTGGTLATPQVISPGGSKTVEVTFSPATEGRITGGLTLLSTDGDTPQLEVPLSGEGVDLCDVCSPIIDVSTGADPNKIDDFFSFLGSPDSRTITVQNIGDLDLTVTNVEVNNDLVATCGAFSVSGFRGSVTLAPWDTTTFQIAYTASSTCLDLPSIDFDSNVAHILSNDPGTPDWVIELQGSGLGL